MTTPRLSIEMRCRCAREDEIVDPDAFTGTITDCPTCGTSYINDNGTWRNTATLGARKRDKLRAIGKVERVTAGMN